MKERLPSNAFLRVHKSFIVAANKIEAVEKNGIFIGSAVIPFGERFRELFFNRLNK